MSDDLKARLRRGIPNNEVVRLGGMAHDGRCLEAADRIETAERQLAEARAECERLREALTRIVTADYNVEHPAKTASYMARIARAALSATDTPPADNTDERTMPKDSVREAAGRLEWLLWNADAEQMKIARDDPGMNMDWRSVKDAALAAGQPADDTVRVPRDPESVCAVEGSGDDVFGGDLCSFEWLYDDNNNVIGVLCQECDWLKYDDFAATAEGDGVYPEDFVTRPLHRSRRSGRGRRA